MRFFLEFRESKIVVIIRPNMSITIFFLLLGYGYILVVSDPEII